MVYHHIIPDEYWDEKLHLTVAIKESKFRKQLSIIKRHFDYSATKIEQTIPLMITFDDGYNCSVFSSKILDEYGFNGVYFMPISNLDSQKPLWIDEILIWFSYVPDNNYQVGEENICIFSEADRQIAYNRYSLKFYSNYAPQEYISNLNSAYPMDKIDELLVPTYNKLRFHGLSMIEVNDLKNRGHVIGGHSSKHDILSKLSKTELISDFNACQNLIGSLYNSDIFAYPFGHPRDLSADVIETCANSKFNYAVINDSFSAEDKYQIPRINIAWYNNKYEIHAHLSGYVSYLKKWIK